MYFVCMCIACMRVLCEAPSQRHWPLEGSIVFTVREMNVAIELWGAFFCVLGFVSVRMFENKVSRRRLTLQSMFALEFAATMGDAIAGIYRGQDGDSAWLATHVGNLIPFVASFLLSATFTTFLVDRVSPRGVRARRWERAAWLLCIAGSIGAVAGLYYTIDPITNLYQRGPLFWMSDLIGGLVVFGDLVVLVANWGDVPKSTRMVMFTYIALPLPLLIVHSMYYGLNLAIIATCSSLFLFFLEMQFENSRIMALQQIALARRELELAEKERDLTETRIASMVSQIQPHFLYNTLDSIYGLCTDDPEMAAEAVALFADYLRGNLQSLRQNSPIPIEQELEHVRNYLELEAMCSYDTIHYRIEPQATGFYIPALSVQPLAENAVKHGVSKRPEGGTVIVRTEETPDCYLITVSDDGVGFDKDTAKADGHAHIGIENISDRLKTMCDASLSIESEVGKGTLATISIPRSQDAAQAAASQ